MRAENGNVALTGEIDLEASDGTFVLALGFGPRRWKRASTRSSACSRISTRRKREYIEVWKAWHARLKDGVPAKARTRLYQISAAVLRTHESKRVEGGIIASLSIPWGFSRLMTTWAAITWPGRETSWRSRAGSSRSARTSTSGACCDICR